MTEQQEMSDEEAIMKIAAAMKDNAPTQDEKQNVHTFLVNVVEADAINRITKISNLRDDKEMNELGFPRWDVRCSLELSRISKHILGNQIFQDYFDEASREVLNTSLSRNGFLLRQATTQTKQIADVTKRRKINKGWFGKQKVEESGGDTTTQNV